LFACSQATSTAQTSHGDGVGFRAHELLLSDGQFLLEGEQSVVATQKEVTFGRACVMKKKGCHYKQKHPFKIMQPNGHHIHFSICLLVMEYLIWLV